MNILTGISQKEGALAEPQSVDATVQAWLTEIEDARKREKDWRKEAKALIDLYEVKESRENEFNILYSNTETLLPALYNNTPRPVVQRKHKDKDPLGAMVSKITERTLTFLLDPGDMEQSPFDSLMETAVLDALVPGRGVTRFKYDAELVEVEGAALETEGAKVTFETVIGEEIAYDRILFGYAKRWKDVPWIAFEHFLTREEAVDVLGEEVGRAIPLTVSSREDDGDDTDQTKPADAAGVKFAHLYEIWDKTKREVVFVSPGWRRGLAKPSVPDPLELQGFYPIPQPLQFTSKITSLLPIPLYKFYEQQAKELNRVTMRINKLTNALKVRGFYDSSIDGMSKIMEAEDNTLIPAENISALAQGRGLDQSIWLMPIKDLIQVLQELYIQRTQVKQVIYEITGISDILRGSSAASETATAQNIKNQWGTLRLKRMQKRVMVYVRRSLRIMAEIAAMKLSQETLAAMSGMQFPTAQQKAQAQAQVQQIQAQQPPPQPGQPVQPPQLPPDLQAELTLPTWEDLLGIMRNSLTKAYHIDIETNSTIDAEATEDQKLVGDFLNALAQFLNGMMPLVQEGLLPFPAAKAMLLAVVRRYRFGSEVEDQLESMQQPPPKPDPNEAKAKADAAVQQQTMEMEKAKFGLEQQAAQQEAQLKAQQSQMDLQIKQQEMELRAKELQMKLAELDRKAQYSQAAHEQKMAQLAAQAAMPPKQPAGA